MLEYHQRYGRPLYIAETSTDTRREDWLRYVVSEVVRARSSGAAVLGATWWPLFDHIDWNSGLTQLEGVVCSSGLYHLGPQFRREESRAAGFFRTFLQEPLQPYDVTAEFPQ